MSTDKTKVIFRKWGKDSGSGIIAVFPELPGDSNPYRTCLSYEHIGQHGAITLDFMRPTHQWTFPASESEYADLLAELESIGYNVRIAHRMTRKDLQVRVKACEV